MQHGHDCHHRQQKSQLITQAQVVIDIAQQHQYQHKSQCQALSGRQNEDAPLREHDAPLLYLRAKQPTFEMLFECGQHRAIFCGAQPCSTWQCRMHRICRGKFPISSAAGGTSLPKTRKINPLSCVFSTTSEIGFMVNFSAGAWGTILASPGAGPSPSACRGWVTRYLPVIIQLCATRPE